MLGTIGAVGAIAAGLTLAVVRSSPDAFDRYLGGLPPVAGVLGVSALAFPVLRHLDSRGWALTDWSRTAWTFVAAGAILFGLVAIIADVALRFPEDLNLPTPEALAFYPVIAWAVEIVLHALPVALLISLLGSPESVSEGRFWVIAISVALIEAVLQAVFATSAATAAFSAIHLLAIGVFQVYLFRRFGFVPMVGWRLAYYSIWHVVWGAARLPLLF
jgi:uncharacterized membrane protein